MEKIFLDHLFQKHILVSTGKEPEPCVFETLFSLANLFGIKITEGRELVQKDMIPYCASMLGENVPEPFYRGFPESVRKLSPDRLLFDQLAHYAVTYGFGFFSRAGHSLFEETFRRIAFQEKHEPKEFVILGVESAEKALEKSVSDLLTSSRPLNDSQFALVRDYVKAYDYQVSYCASKNTAVRLMVAMRDLQFAKFLQLSDVIKVLDELQFSEYDNENLRKINLRNQDRKFLTKLIDELFLASRCDLVTCFEKKDLWCGLLHHLHYRPKNDEASDFLKAMRGKENRSVYAAFEKAMGICDVRRAVLLLQEGKGTGALLRNLNYIVSRMEAPEDLDFVLEQLETKNNILLLQLLMRFSDKGGIEQKKRTFVFTRHQSLLLHAETEEELARRKSWITKAQKERIAAFVEEKLRENLKGRLGRVYVDEAMKNMAFPLQETASQSGFGVMAKGSRLSIPEGKKIRAFTYWEKVHDIDLSVIGITGEGEQIEFSWRTMAGKQGGGILYSGDETSGYHGGSEYFDVDPAVIRKAYPRLRYLIFCNNVFSGVNFETCYCTAGYMLREQMDSGEIFEPKTVQTSFRVNCPSTFAYLFGIDLNTSEFIWLNVNQNNGATVAGENNLSFLTDYFGITKVFNVYRLFELLATELVTDPAKASVIASDRAEIWEQARGGEGKEWIHSYDFERLMALV